MRFLKFFVVLMGVLIVLGFGFLGVEVYRRAANPHYRERWGQKEAATVPFHTVVDVPARSKADIATILNDNRLILKVVLPTGETQFYVLDSKTGQVKGEFAVGGRAP